MRKAWNHFSLGTHLVIRNQRLAALIALTGSLIGAASPLIASAIETGAEALTPAQTQADFDLMRKALDEAHAGH